MSAAMSKGTLSEHVMLLALSSRSFPVMEVDKGKEKGADMNRQDEERLLPAEKKEHSEWGAPWPKFIPVLPDPLGGE